MFYYRKEKCDFPIHSLVTALTLELFLCITAMYILSKWAIFYYNLISWHFVQNIKFTMSTLAASNKRCLRSYNNNTWLPWQGMYKWTVELRWLYANCKLMLIRLSSWFFRMTQSSMLPITELSAIVSELYKDFLWVLVIGIVADKQKPSKEWWIRLLQSRYQYKNDFLVPFFK